MFAMRELSGPLSLLIEMVTYTSYCNEPFSLGVLQLLKVTHQTPFCRSATLFHEGSHQADGLVDVDKRGGDVDPDR